MKSKELFDVMDSEETHKNRDQRYIQLKKELSHEFIAQETERFLKNGGVIHQLRGTCNDIEFWARTVK
jgi:hypothetical protein